MFKKYEKTFRMKVPGIEVPGKRMLSDDDASRLRYGNSITEEKLDGANVGIIRHRDGFTLQKRGGLVGQSEHAQFQFFHGWANSMRYDAIMALPENYIYYGELMYAVHSIYYDKLPDWVVFFDVYHTKNKRWLPRQERVELLDSVGLASVPLIKPYCPFNVNGILNIMPDKSAFGDEIEGMVIKSYSKKTGEYRRAKVVRAEFLKRMEQNNQWRHSKMKINQLA